MRVLGSRFLGGNSVCVNLWNLKIKSIKRSVKYLILLEGNKCVSEFRKK